MKCIKCSNPADIEDQDICGYCATEELFEMVPYKNPLTPEKANPYNWTKEYVTEKGEGIGNE